MSWSVNMGWGCVSWGYNDPMGEEFVAVNGGLKGDGTLSKRFPFMKLPQVLREEIILMSLPEELYPPVDPNVVEFRYPMWSDDGDPRFVSALASMGNEELRLECILLALQSRVLKVTTMDDAVKLRGWLARVDFSSMKKGNLNPLKNGYNAVRGLYFSDENRVRVHHVILNCYDRSRHYWENRTLEPPTAGGDLELVRMCEDVRKVIMKISLTKRFVAALSEGRGMHEALKTRDFGDYNVKELLDLKGHELLDLRLYTKTWTEPELDEAQVSVIASWLNEGFKKRGQAVEILVKCLGFKER